MQGADNQQERLDGYIAGYVDGEGTFSITLSRATTSQFGWQLIPEFHVSQNGDRSEVLWLIRERIGCGYIKPNGRKDRALVLVVRRRADLLMSVIPFFERVPLLSSKRAEFDSFARIVRAMENREHLTLEGFRKLVTLAVAMNGRGRYRRIRWLELIGLPESSETVRQTGAGALEDTVRAAWRHAESGRNDLTLDLFGRE